MNQNTSMYSYIGIFPNFCVFVFIVLVEKSSAAHFQYEACAPKTCGSLSIKFPFYIHGVQDSYCGLAGFELNCSNSGSSIIHIPDNDYVIGNISYENQTFRVHNAATLSISNCLPQIGNITVKTDRLDVGDASKLHLLSHCNNSLPEVLWKYRKYTCDQKNRDRWGLTMLENDKNLNRAFEECETDVLAPVEVHGDGRGSGGNGVMDYEGMLRRGFVLNWKASDCRICEQSGGRCGYNTNEYRLWCFCPDRPHYARCKSRKKYSIVILGAGKKNSKVILGAAASVGGFAILVILACCFRRFSFYDFVDVVMRKTEKSPDIEDFVKNYGSLAPKRYHYSDVKKMTNSFKIKLGQGGYGSVYEGKLHDCSPIAVKVLKESEGSGEEFINEVASISRTSHVNIVNLQGFCYEGRKRALIYEFMPNGSLDKFIYGGKSSTNHQLSVQTLYKISVGIARGLEYLHSGCNTRILHFDIKPHNILLDRDFSPKISDFGLAKLCPGKESIVSVLGARGTVGYIAPEVFCKNFGAVSHKSDVYSYGMMVFEMVGGRKNIDVGVDHTSEIYFPDWIYRKLDQSDNLGLDGITNEKENELARKMIIVSLWCIQTDPSNRPSMTKVVEMLEGSHQPLQIPPRPILFSPSGASDCISTVNMT